MDARRLPGAGALRRIRLIRSGGAVVEPHLVLGVEEQTARMDDERRIPLVILRLPAFSDLAAKAEERHPIAVAGGGGILHRHIEVLIRAHMIIQHPHGGIHIVTPGAAVKIALRPSGAVDRPVGGERLLLIRRRSGGGALHAAGIIRRKHVRERLALRRNSSAHRYGGEQQSRHRQPANPALEGLLAYPLLHTVPSPSCISNTDKIPSFHARDSIQKCISVRNKCIYTIYPNSDFLWIK